MQNDLIASLLEQLRSRQANPDPGFSMSPDQFQGLIADLQGKFGPPPQAQGGAMQAYTSVGGKSAAPGVGRTAMDAPGFDIQKAIEGGRKLMGSGSPNPAPRAPASAKGGMTRVSPGMYRNAKGNLIKSKTGK